MAGDLGTRAKGERHRFRNPAKKDKKYTNFHRDQKGRKDPHREVDFVVKQGLDVKQLILVCYDIKHYDTKEREIRALIKASEELRCTDLLVITKDHEGEEEIQGKKIKYTPLWKWLLND